MHFPHTLVTASPLHALVARALFSPGVTEAVVNEVPLVAHLSGSPESTDIPVVKVRNPATGEYAAYMHLDGEWVQ